MDKFLRPPHASASWFARPVDLDFGMGLSFKIENMTSLPDGGPLEINIPGKRGIDIGRDQHLDWTLPDPTRFISGKHCEVRYKDGAYWLHDVSTNGTFLNGSEERMRSPHRLRTGDRLEIGDYIVAATVEAEPLRPAVATNVSKMPGDDLWHVAGTVAPPAAIEPLRSPIRGAPATVDFLDRMVETSGPANDAIWNDSARPASNAGAARLDWGGEATSAAWRPDGGEATSDGDPGQGGDGLAKPAPHASEQPRMPSAYAYTDKAFVPVAIPPKAASEAIAALGSGEAPAIDFVKLVAKGAGVHESVFAKHSPAELAEVLGLLLRMTTTNLQQLLSARSELKDVVRSASHTTIVKSNNNPLKFSPDAEEAIRMMFAPTSQSYLNAPRAIEQSFNDLKQHQGQIFSAIQGAVGLIQRDLDPKIIEAETETERGLGSIVVSRKAKLWDAYLARWRLGTTRHENGFLGMFFDYFAASYDRASSDRRPQ